MVRFFNDSIKNQKVCLAGLVRAVALGTGVHTPLPVAARALRPGMLLDIVKDAPVSSLMVRFVKVPYS